MDKLWSDVYNPVEEKVKTSISDNDIRAMMRMLTAMEAESE